MTSAQYREEARHVLTGRWGRAILVAFLASLLGANATTLSFSNNGSSGSQGNYWASYEGFYNSAVFRAFLFFMIGMVSITLVWTLITFLIGGAIDLGQITFFTGLAQGKDMQVSDLFSQFHLFGKALGLRIVMNLFIGLWSLLFMIPGIMAAYRYGMAPDIMAENPDVGIMEAIELSKQMMMGNKFRLFCLQWSFFGWMLVGVLTFGIGLLWVNPYMEAATAVFYLDISSLPGGGDYGYTKY